MRPAALARGVSDEEEIRKAERNARGGAFRQPPGSSCYALSSATYGADSTSVPK